MVSFDVVGDRDNIHPEVRRVVLDGVAGQLRYSEVRKAVPSRVPDSEIDRTLGRLARDGEVALLPVGDVLNIDREPRKTEPDE